MCHLFHTDFCSLTFIFVVLSLQFVPNQIYAINGCNCFIIAYHCLSDCMVETSKDVDSLPIRLHG